MGRGGAWRQEELKRFSSWVTTKVGLSQRAVGPQPGGWWRSRHKAGSHLWGQHLPAFAIPLGSAQNLSLGKFVEIVWSSVLSKGNSIREFGPDLPGLGWDHPRKSEKHSFILRGMVRGYMDNLLRMSVVL